MLPCFSQTSIQGFVKDSANVPLSDISVVLKVKDDNSVVDYTFTNNSGFYSLNITPNESYQLIFSSLTTVKKTYSIVNNIGGSDVFIKDIILERKTINLRETIVSANLPIVEKKDTVSIRLEKYIKGEEQVIEDVLKNIPGVNVDASGRISVQGKPIDRVLIESDDLFENGYELLTKNLRASVIDRIEIINNFSKKLLLKGIKDSDKVAINLKLKDSINTTFFGNSSASSDYHSYYDADLNISSLSRKFKTYIFSNLNNVGTDVTGQITNLIKSNQEGVYSKLQAKNSSLGRTIKLRNETPDFGNERINLNNSKLITTSSIFNIGGKIKTKFVGVGSFYDKNFFENGILEFNFNGENFTNSRSTTATNKKDTYFGKIDSNYKLNGSSEIDLVIDYFKINYKDTSSRLFNEENVFENDVSEHTVFNNKLTYTNKLNTNTAISFFTFFSKKWLPENYYLSSPFYDDFFDSEQLVNGKQNINSKSTEFNFSSTLNYNINNKSKLEFGFSYFNLSNDFSSEFILFDDVEESFSPGQNFINNVLYKTKGLGLSSSYKFIQKKFEFNTKIDASFIDFVYKDSTKELNNSPVNLIPTLAIKYKLNKSDKLALVYSRNVLNLLIDDIAPNFIQTGFDFFQRGTESLNQEKTNFFLLNFVHGDWTKEFLINGQVLYSNGKQILGNARQIEQTFTTVTKKFFENQNSLNTNISLDQYIKILKSNIKLKLDYTESWQNDTVNSTDREINSTTYNLAFEMRSAFKDFNYHLGIKGSVSKIKTNLERRNTFVFNFLDFNFKYSDKGTIDIENEHYLFNNSASENNNFFFTDIKANYVVKENKLNLKMSLRNIWNTNSASFVFLNDFSTSEFTYRLFPRMFTIGLDYRF